MQLGSSLTRFQAGIPLASQLTAARLNAMMDEIEASRMRQGVGYGFSRDSGGTSLTIASQIQAQQQQQPAYYAYNLVTNCTGVSPIDGTTPTPELSDVDTALLAFYAANLNLPSANGIPALNDTINLTWGNSVVMVLAICTGPGGPGNALTFPNGITYGWMTVGAITS